MKAVLRISFVLASLGGMAALTACDDIGEALGMEHKTPDEGNITTNPPLSLPPDYTLKPPRETSKSDDPKSTEHPEPTDPQIHNQDITK